ncbi:hypothetical protein, partial [Serratia marcescens]|uniref:hypothetical protein n=1 Tax=Serratia marcescens TaxID=615 RepID=UPI00195314F0
GLNCLPTALAILAASFLPVRIEQLLERFRSDAFNTNLRFFLKVLFSIHMAGAIYLAKLAAPV